MKTNLDKVFKTDKFHEQEGIEIKLSEDISFQVRRFGGSNSTKVNEVMAKYHKPFASQIQSGLIKEEELNKIMAKVFSEACLVSWKGIIDEETKTEIPCNFENAVKIFCEMPDLLNDLLKRSQNIDYFKVELGNY